MDISSLEQKAIDFARRGDFGTEAKQVNEELAGLAPDNQGAWTRLARCNIELGLLDDANAALEKVLQINPQNMIARSLLQESIRREVRLAPEPEPKRTRSGKISKARKSSASGGALRSGFGRAQFAALQQLAPNAALDSLGRPLFAYGKSIHDNCERRAHYDAGQYVETWGDAGHRQGYCLYKMGCKGPVAFQNCPNVGWNEGTNWPIGCGHPCLGCSEPRFWDKMTPFYQHLSGIPGFGLHSKVDEVGLWATAGVAAAFAAHGLVQLGRRQFKTAGDKRREEHHPPPEPPAERPSGPTPEGGAA